MDQEKTINPEVNANPEAPEALTAPETEQVTPQETPKSNDSLPSDGIALNEDGEIVFGADIIKEADESIVAPKLHEQPVVPPEAVAFPQTAAYSAEEISNIDLSQLDFSTIDESRLPEAVRPFYPYIKAQTMRLRAFEAELSKAASYLQAQAEQMRQPEQSHKEPQSQPIQNIDIAAEAARRLGIKAEDFDPFNSQHRYAEMQVFREIEAANVPTAPEPQAPQVPPAQQLNVSPLAQAQFSALEAELAASIPDYEDFNTYATKLMETMPPAMKQIVQGHAARGDMRPLRDVAYYMRNKFEESKGGTKKAVKNAADKKVIDPPPTLEGAVGGVAGAAKGIDLSQLAKLENDPNAQAKLLEALI